MDYIRETRAFMESLILNPLSAGQIALWNALMHVCNKTRWEEWFSAPSRVLEAYTGLTRDGIYKARKVLQKRGLIEMRTKASVGTQYKMISLLDGAQDDIQDSTQDSIQDGIHDSMQESIHDSMHDSMQGCIHDSIRGSMHASTELHYNKHKTKNIKQRGARARPPTVEEVQEYCQERNNGINAETFVDFYASKGWKVGNSPMKDWKACVRTWEQRRKGEKKNAEPDYHEAPSGYAIL